jgi:hypothetical protein
VRKTVAWSEATGGGGLDRGGGVMAPMARSDSAQGTHGVALPSGPRRPDRWWLWASSNRGGVGSDLASLAALSSGPGQFTSFSLFDSFPNDFP